MLKNDIEYLDSVVYNWDQTEQLKRVWRNIKKNIIIPKEKQDKIIKDKFKKLNVCKC